MLRGVSLPFGSLRAGTVALVAVCALLATAAQADAATYTFSSEDAVTIADDAAASPYPSAVDVSGLSGTITDVDLTLRQFGHECPGDVDIALMAPGATVAYTVMSDSFGCSPVSGVNLTFDDDAAGVPDLTTGADLRSQPAYDGLNGDNSTDPYPAPGPSFFWPNGDWPRGGDPNGIWSLYVVDDFARDGGQIAGGWTLQITTTAPPPPRATFSSEDAVTIADDAAASPYPSAVDVSGLSGTITDVDLTLRQFGHECPGDVDIALMAPGATVAYTVMSDSFGCSPVSGVNLTFDDDAAGVPDLTTGADLRSQPAYDGLNGDNSTDPYPAPGPSFFWPNGDWPRGGDPNGIWSLYVVDDFARDGGQIAGGWTLDFVLSFPLTNTAPSVISGSARVGETLSWTAGAWNAHPVQPSVERQWYRCVPSGSGPCTPEAIAGETGPTYTLTEDDVDATVYIVETATTPSETATQDSNSLGPVQPAVEDWPFSGFFSPVDDQPAVNVAKAGSSIPVKFGLGGDRGLEIFEAGSPRSRSVDCETQAPTDTIEQTAGANNAGLNYDATSDRYTYVWRTDRGWGGQCRTLILETLGGTHEASFRFK